jgi:antitoxin component YwqK of YwqJK toxin-antitoxin module
MSRRWLEIVRLLSVAAALGWPAATRGDEPAPAPEEPKPAEESGYYAGSPAGGEETKAEPIQERYPSGAVKIERHVVQDAEGNYVNHGLWTQFDEKGRITARGEYAWGQRHGVWSRIHRPNPKELFAQPEYAEFQPPFVSEATFDHGQLHGAWTVYDAKNRKASEFAFERGRRQGKSTWYHPSGRKFREENYHQDQLDGERLEWNANNQVTSRRMFKQGRELAKKVKAYSPGQPETEAIYLFARQIADIDYDWWNGMINVKVTGKDGNDQRHGPFLAWHQNGQKKLEGRYEDDRPTGKFVWWYENGQKAIEGEYTDGRQTGTWVWWHDNGQKALQGDYQAGAEIGKWTWWKPDGQVSNAMHFNEQQGAVASLAPLSPDLGSLPTLQRAPVSEASATSSVRKSRRTAR